MLVSVTLYLQCTLGIECCVYRRLDPMEYIGKHVYMLVMIVYN